VSVLPKRRENKAADRPVEKVSDEELERLIQETKQLLATIEIDAEEVEK
jgi:hypothetical protein